MGDTNMGVDATSQEEGECSSEDELGGYTPIQRPSIDNNRRQVQQNTHNDTDSEDEGPLGRGFPGQSDSDSDEDRPEAKKRNTAGPWGRRDAIVPDSGNNEAFKQMAAAFQADRKKDKRKNNVWGSFLQEDSLNSELSGIGVKRSIKDLGGDRGAEAYDFNIPIQLREKERQKQREKERNNEMDDYWADNKSEAKEGCEENMDDDAEVKVEGDVKVDQDIKDSNENEREARRGTKRSIKERLGKTRVPIDRYHGQKLAFPGEPKHLIDISEEDLLETSDQEFASILAERLGEEKPALIEGIVSKFGKTVAHKVYKLTQAKEVEGGIEINNGARRRTSGGVFLYLLKTEPSHGVSATQIKKYLADAQKQEERKFLEAKSRKKKKDYDKEMKDFLDLRKVVKAKQEEENNKEVDMEGEGNGIDKQTDENNVEEDALVDIGSNLFASVIGHFKKDKESCESRGVPDAPPSSVPIVPPYSSVPDVPPNSVERTLQSYDDDLFSDTQNIDIM